MRSITHDFDAIHFRLKEISGGGPDGDELVLALFRRWINTQRERDDAPEDSDEAKALAVRLDETEDEIVRTAWRGRCARCENLPLHSRGVYLLGAKKGLPPP